jgi:hypothetical protein
MASKTKKNGESNFVTSISPITGLDDGRYVRTTSGYIGVVKVPGIDIFNMKDNEREKAFIAFGNAIVALNIPVKIVFISCKPDFSSQKANLAQHELKQQNEVRKEILSRMRSNYEWLETNSKQRLPFVLFFSDDKSKIDVAMNRFISCMAMEMLSPSICYENDIVTVFKALLQGGGH